MGPNDPLIIAMKVLCGTAEMHLLQEVTARTSDWSGLISTAQRENLLPVLHWATRECYLPPEVRSVLEGEYWNSLARSVVLERELERVLASLARGGITPIVLKGAALAESVYSDPGLRPMSDIDLMVHQEDFGSACEMVASDGAYETRVDMAETYMELTHAVFVGVVSRRVTIEIHKSLLGDVTLRNEDALWENAELNSKGRLVLCPEDLLAHLCVHSALRHQLRSLSQFLDIALVARRYESLDWQAFTSRCISLGAAHPACVALQRVKEVLDVDIPERVLDDLAAARQGVLRGFALSLVMDSGERHALRMMGRLALQKGLRGKIKYARWHLFPSANWLSRSMGMQRMLVYPYRFYRIARAGAVFAGYVGRRIVSKMNQGRV